jgi:hypothetical protein
MLCDGLGPSGLVAIAFSLRKKIVDVQSRTLASFLTLASSIALKPHAPPLSRDTHPPNLLANQAWKSNPRLISLIASTDKFP